VPLTLILLRHAKSGWDDPIASDHERTLTDRGTRDAHAIGAWLRQNHYLPDAALSSDATRTRQTMQGVLSGLNQTDQTQYLSALYNASVDTILRLIKRQSAKTLLICAHNPGIGFAAQQLALTPPQHQRFDDYPTAATTVMRFDAADWSDIRQGTVTDFVIPADLKK
jgi:phosphohistidine phosphatase